MTEQNEEIPQRFVTTKNYRRFGEMCDACRRARVVGLGYGPQAQAKPNLRNSTRNGICSNRSCPKP